MCEDVYGFALPVLSQNSFYLSWELSTFGKLLQLFTTGYCFRRWQLKKYDATQHIGISIRYKKAKSPGQKSDCLDLLWGCKRAGKRPKLSHREFPFCGGIHGWNEASRADSTPPFLSAFYVRKMWIYLEQSWAGRGNLNTIQSMKELMGAQYNVVFTLHEKGLLWPRTLQQTCFSYKLLYCLYYPSSLILNCF